MSKPLVHTYSNTTNESKPAFVQAATIICSLLIIATTTTIIITITSLKGCAAI